VQLECLPTGIEQSSSARKVVLFAALCVMCGALHVFLYQFTKIFAVIIVLKIRVHRKISVLHKPIKAYVLMPLVNV
jgi:hypothetical protein